ncbi:MAG: transketolase [Thermoplasmata archaeon]|nr:transketolase [Thermoplasmata archaeon]RLF70989.1 MAG: transketolase [Thermoplasmata archaeon]RLF71048.1 MAG: transketolase [Thermoplasmata archaeon]RLF75684.1 MAG: transketolase [Thermoplasmata archaeon]
MTDRLDYLRDLEKVIPELEEKALRARKWILKMTTEAGSGHPGGSLSVVDVLVALYFRVMRHNPLNPRWENRDRLVLSKGHAAPALYAVLAMSGYFPEEELLTLRKLGSRLQGHPSMLSTPGVDMSTGSLGQGLSVGIGMALAGKLDRRDYRVYVVLGDGECQEGQVWEAAMFAGHHRIENLCAVVDKNKLQLDGATDRIVSIDPIGSKFEAFGWNTIQINGHDFRQILIAFREAEKVKDKPTVIISNTIKGKGVSFMEGVVKYHGKPLTREELKMALEELGGDIQ